MMESYSYEFLPDVAIADAAFEARASDLAGLFIAAALATASVMVELSEIDTNMMHEFSLGADNREDLLYVWLAELVYLKDTEQIIYKSFTLDISTQAGRITLQGRGRGGVIDPARHTLGQDVKAVTYHLFGIKEVNGTLVARVVLDI